MNVSDTSPCIDLNVRRELDTTLDTTVKPAVTGAEIILHILITAGLQTRTWTYTIHRYSL